MRSFDLIIPQAEKAVIDAAVKAAVATRKTLVGFRSGQRIEGGYSRGDLNHGIPQFAGATPARFTSGNITEESPGSLVGPTQYGFSMRILLSKKVGKTLPWVTVREALDSGFKARMIERSPDAGPWPCDYSGAKQVKIVLAKEKPRRQSPPKIPPGVLVAEAELQSDQIQDLAEHVAEIKKAAVGLELKFQIRIELGGVNNPTDKPVEQYKSIIKGYFGRNWSLSKNQTNTIRKPK